MTARVPVHVLTGFLGAGKTTLLNRLLTEQHGERVAVIVNEFGDVPIDGRLVVRAHDELVELANGCVCCTVRGDLTRTLGRLLAGRRSFERVVIETSGLASPGPVLQTLLVDPELAAGVEPRGVVTLAHAAQVAEELELHPEAREQVGYADLLLLNHADRADEATLTRAEAALRVHNAAAPIERTTQARVDLERVLVLEPLAALTPERFAAAPTHTPGAGTVALRSETPLELHTLKVWLQFLATRRTHEIWRMKGVLACTGQERATVVQAVYQWLELGPGEEPAPDLSVLVILGRDLDRAELERGWEVVRRGTSSSRP